MRFTIGIPARNAEAYLAEAIRSAIRQTRPADEILVVDDGSTDRTASIATAAEWKDRVRYVRNDAPSGWANAFNRVAELARCDWLIMLSADDLLDGDCVQEIERALATFPSVRHCYVGYRYIDSGGKETAVSPMPHSRIPILLSGKQYAHLYLKSSADGAPIHRFLGGATLRSLWVESCRIRQESGLIGDNDFFLRLAGLTDVVGINSPLVSVRLHESSVTSRLESLNYRLAEDYAYQRRGMALLNHLLPETKELIASLASRYTTALLIEAFQRVRPEYYRKARQLYNELKHNGENPTENSDRLMARLLWFLVERDHLHLLDKALASLSRLKRKRAIR